MWSFPRATKKVSPLYRNKGVEGSGTERGSPVYRPLSSLAQHKSIFDQVIRSNMYEQVSDRCATTIINPSNNNNKFNGRSSFQKAGNATEEQDSNKREYHQERAKELGVGEAPVKPPRKNKLRRLSSNDGLKGRDNNKMRNGHGDACIDVDHINVETTNNLKNNDLKHKKNKFTDASVQTSPLIPYRLRFWPKGSCDLKCGPEEKNCTKVRLSCCCRFLSQWLLSQVGLTLVVIAWALLGAYAFYKTEGPREFLLTEQLNQMQNELSVELATSLRQTDKYQETWFQTINAKMQRHEELLLEAVSAGFGEGGGGNIWTYPGCILFAASLLTTLGFGAPVPRTPLGRGAAVLFSAIGIPLHFLLILNMGNLGAVKLQQLAYHRSSSTHTDIPTPPRPRWLTLFPIAAIAFYYAMGVILFGFVRGRDVIDSLMFPLDFTAAGGVATTDGHVRILYALYLECAVTLAALVVSLIQASATRGIVDIGLRLGLLTNT